MLSRVIIQGLQALTRQPGSVPNLIQIQVQGEPADHADAQPEFQDTSHQKRVVSTDHTAKTADQT